MNTQPEALRLADSLFADATSPIDLKAAAELRRLHSRELHYEMIDHQNKLLHALNQELLRSLSWIDQRCPAVLLLQDVHRVHQEAAFDAGVCARAAIAKAEAAQQ